DGSQLCLKLKTMVEHVVFQNVSQAESLCAEILDAIELGTVEDYPTPREAGIPVEVSMAEKSRKSAIVVDRNDAVLCADTFISNILQTDSRIHVIVGDENDVVKYYKHISRLHSNRGVQGVWNDKKFGGQISPRIIIGTLNYFTTRDPDRKDRSRITAVFLHADDLPEQWQMYPIDFESGNLDAFLVELFVLTTVTLEHVQEIEVQSIQSENDLRRIMKCWPSEHQVLEESKILSALQK
ncbi:hypothetical protein PFISCL1PPCAC_24019, partial [Pristionchus fissidentatus]